MQADRLGQPNDFAIQRDDRSTGMDDHYGSSRHRSPRDRDDFRPNGSGSSRRHGEESGDGRGSRSTGYNGSSGRRDYDAPSNPVIGENNGRDRESRRNDDRRNDARDYSQRDRLGGDHGSSNGRTDRYDSSSNDRYRSSSRRDETDDRSGRRGRDYASGGDRDRDRDAGSRRNNDYNGSSSYGRRDDRGGNRSNGNDYGSNRNGRDDRGDRSGSGRGGRSSGANGGSEVFGAGNQQRSPTPEATIPISKRKRTRTAWDIRAPGFEEFTSIQAKMTGIFNLPGQVRPMTGFTSVGGSAALPDLHLGGGSAAAAAAAASSMSSGAAYARQARRLYVGNITLQANEQNVADFFNQQMREKGWAIDDDPAGVQAPESVVSVQVNHEKSYAFVEYRSAAEASSAMGFAGIVFQGQVLKIRRPKDYIGNEHSATTHIPGVVSTNVPDTVNKIFIGGLPSYLNDIQVMELLQSFGELRAFNLVKEGNTNASRGFAFCEYVDPNITDIACQGLNGMELGDRYLVVQRAAIGANPGKVTFGNDMGMGGVDKVAPNIIAAATAGEAVPTRVLQMLNMVTPEELADPEEFLEICEDIKEECGKYGQVVEVKVPRPAVTDSGKFDARASETIEDLGKVFVMFETIEDTKKAMMSIAGRQFGGRSIICAYADEEKMV